jgi:non-specific protein-tyrosine kinase
MPEQNEIELRWILTVIHRWIWLIVGCTFLAAVVAYFVTAQMTPYYEATAILMIQPAQDTHSTEYSILVAGERLALTYSEMLKSKPVLDTVLSQNQLKESADELAKRVSAQPVRDTQLIHLTVEDPSPNKAASLANAIASEFILYIQNLQTERYAGTLKDIQDKMDALTLQMEAIQTENQTLNDKKVTNDSELVKLENLLAEDNSAYQQLYQESQALQLTASTLAGKIIIAEAARPSDTYTNTATLTLLFDQSLVAEEGSYSVETYEEILVGKPVLEAAITELDLELEPAVLGTKINTVAVPGTQLVQLNVADPDLPQALLLANKIAEVFIDQMLALQVKTYSDRMSSLQAQMDILQMEMEGTQASIAALTSDNLELNSQIASLERQLVEHRSDHRALQQDFNQMQLDTENAADAVVIAEPASIPEESSQQRMMYIILTSFTGTMLGFGSAFLIEYLGDVIRTPENISQAYNLSTLGSIGTINKSENELVAQNQPRSPTAEAFRKLATNIAFFGMDNPLRTILVTSPNAQDGKSLVVANLGTILAQRGLQVVVVDADLRVPRQHHLFELNPGVGLTSALLDGSASEKLQQVGVKGLKILTSGDLPPNPAEVVASKRIPVLIDKLAGDADLVLVDSPPVLPVTDATILASIVDGVVLVVKANRTRQQELRDAIEILRKVEVNLLGVVLNGVTSRGDRYYQYYGDERTVKIKRRRVKSTEGLENSSKGYRLDRLTPREREVALLVDRGYTKDEIAAELGIALGTVNSHVNHAATKLGVKGVDALKHKLKTEHRSP